MCKVKYLHRRPRAGGKAPAAAISPPLEPPPPPPSAAGSAGSPSSAADGEAPNRLRQRCVSRSKLSSSRIAEARVRCARGLALGERPRKIPIDSRMREGAGSAAASLGRRRRPDSSTPAPPPPARNAGRLEQHLGQNVGGTRRRRRRRSRRRRRALVSQCVSVRERGCLGP